PALVEHVEHLTEELRRMDDQFGGGAVLEIAKGHVRHVLEMIDNGQYSDTVGRRLYGATAELMRLGGWLSFDAGQHAQAQRFWLAGLRCAHVASDRATGANILGCMSDQAKDLSRYGEAVRLAEAARHGYPGASPKVSAILHLRAADAYAPTG